MIEVFDDITEAEYISAHFIRNRFGEIFLVRKLDRFLQLTPWTLSINTPNINKMDNELDQYLKGDILEMLSWIGDIGFLKTLVERWKCDLKLGFDNTATKIESDRKHIDRSDYRTHKEDAYYEYLEVMYGITIDDRCDFTESLLDNSDRRAIITSTLIDKVILRNRKDKKLYNNVNPIRVQPVLKVDNKYQVLDGKGYSDSMVISKDGKAEDVIYIKKRPGNFSKINKN